MDEQNVKIVRLGDARRVLTDGAIRSEVAFQNEVNLLIATLDEICDRAMAEPPQRSSSRR
jgi:hypothetical protein